MKTLLTLYILLLSTLCFSQTSLQPFSLSNFVENYASSHVLSGNTTAIAVAVISKGDILLTRTYGYADYDKLELLNSSHVFNVGYLSKLYTAVAVLNLLQYKKITLHSTYDSYLTDILPHSSKVVTIKDLLTQSAGIVDPIINVRVYDPLEIKPLSVFLSDNLPEYFVNPGTLVSNSSYSYALLGLIIERVTGHTFEGYMENSLFSKYGLKNTTFSPVYATDNDLKEVSYYSIENSKLKHIKKTYSHMVPAQGLLSNINDIANFIALLDKDMILKKRFKNMLFMNQFEDIDSHFSTSFIFNPEIYRGVPYYSCFGGDAAPGSAIFYIPQEERYFIFLSNTFSSDFNKKFMQDYIDSNPFINKKNIDEYFIGYNRELYGTYNYANIPVKDFTQIFKLFNYVTISGYTLYGDDTYIRVKYHGKYPVSFQKDEVYYPIDQYVYKSKDRNLYIKVVTVDDKKYLINSSSYQDVFCSSGFKYSPLIQKFFFSIFILFFPIFLLYYFLKGYTHFTVFLICLINILYLLALFFMLFYVNSSIYPIVYFFGGNKLLWIIFLFPIISLILNAIYYKKIPILTTVVNVLFFIVVLYWRASLLSII